MARWVVCLVFRGVGYNQGFLFVHRGFLFIIDGLEYLTVAFIQCRDIDILPEPEPGNTEDSGLLHGLPVSSFFFKVGNDILSPVEAVELPVSPAAQPGIGTIDEPGAAKILDDLCLERFQGRLLILVTGYISKASGIPSASMNNPMVMIGLGRCSLLFPYCRLPSGSSISK